MFDAPMHAPFLAQRHLRSYNQHRGGRRDASAAGRTQARVPLERWSLLLTQFCLSQCFKITTAL